ncbi:Hsp20/alpha crystallin family protein [Dokdonella sp.]|uniref:Hsp20/alpha crystallin family protein n=1 Tax=Dokdonella sp. TaxID=2291710 RepID=UPI002F41D8CD
MSSLTRWNPFKPLARFDAPSEFDDLFRAFPLRSAWRDFELQPDIRIDVSEDTGSYRVKAEMPGVDKNDIELSIDGNQVTIGAEIKRDVERKDGETELYAERYYGKARRMFSLPGEVDGSKAEARYDKGVLSITLPKKANGQSRKIAIS